MPGSVFISLLSMLLLLLSLLSFSPLEKTLNPLVLAGWSSFRRLLLFGRLSFPLRVSVAVLVVVFGCLFLLMARFDTLLEEGDLVFKEKIYLLILRFFLLCESVMRPLPSRRNANDRGALFSFVCLSVRLSVRLSVCLSVCLSLFDVGLLEGKSGRGRWRRCVRNCQAVVDDDDDDVGDERHRRHGGVFCSRRLPRVAMCSPFAAHSRSAGFIQPADDEVPLVSQSAARRCAASISGRRRVETFVVDNNVHQPANRAERRRRRPAPSATADRRSRSWPHCFHSPPKKSSPNVSCHRTP